MGSTSLQILLTLKDEATAALQQFANTAKNVGTASSSGLAQIGKTIEDNRSAISTAATDFTIIGGAIDAAMGLAVKSAADAQAKLASMHTTLKAMGQDVPAISDAILKAAQSTVQLGFDNETSALSITKFFQRTKDMTAALELNQTAMDLARVKRLDLEQATNLLNMALSGQGRILGQYGIEIKDAATPLEALRQLQEQVGGQAVAFSKTFEGQMQVMTASSNQFMQLIGNQLLPILTQLLEGINAIIVKVKDWSEAHPELFRNIVLITAVIGILLTAIGGGLGLVLVLGSAITAFGTISTLLAGLAIPIGLVIVSIGAIIAIIIYWIAHWKDLHDTVIWVWNGIVDKITIAWESIKTVFKDAIDWIMTNVLDPLESRINSIINAISRITNTAKSIGSNVVGGMTAVGHAIGFADGGIVTKPTFAMVGEAGPEAIIPLSKARSVLGGSNGGGINIYLSGTFYTESEMAEKFGNKIAGIITQQLKLRTI